MISLRAPAKINLCLNVASPNLDGGQYNGYHKLESLAAFAVDCFDVISIEKSPKLSLEVKGEFGSGLSSDGDNLIIRAADLIRQKYGLNLGANIVLDKNLPVASGIGGGSSDCAAAIIGLNELWQLGLCLEEMENIGAELGADVPVCIRKKPVIMREYGAKFDEAPKFVNLPTLLINPLVATPTNAVYQKYDRIGAFPKSIENIYFDCYDVAQTAKLLNAFRNDLQVAAIELVPEIGNIIDFLENQTGQLVSRMSGSGATCFAIFDDLENAKQAQIVASDFFGKDNIWAKATILEGNLI